MNETQLKSIINTIEGYPVKDLRWKPLDNIIVGLVKCPITGRDNLNDGYVSCTWKKNGSVTLKFGGYNRKDLYLKTSYEN